MKYRIKEKNNKFYIEVWAETVELDPFLFFFFKKVKCRNWFPCGVDGTKLRYSRPPFMYCINPSLPPFDSIKEAVKQIEKFKFEQRPKESAARYFDENGFPFPPPTHRITKKSNELF